MFEGIFVYGVLAVVLIIVGFGVAAWLYSMTKSGEIQTRGHKLGWW